MHECQEINNTTYGFPCVQCGKCSLFDGWIRQGNPPPTLPPQAKRMTIAEDLKANQDYEWRRNNESILLINHRGNWTMATWYEELIINAIERHDCAGVSAQGPTPKSLTKGEIRPVASEIMHLSALENAKEPQIKITHHTAEIVVKAPTEDGPTPYELAWNKGDKI